MKIKYGKNKIVSNIKCFIFNYNKKKLFHLGNSKWNTTRNNLGNSKWNTTKITWESERVFHYL